MSPPFAGIMHAFCMLSSYHGMTHTASSAERRPLALPSPARILFRAGFRINAVFMRAVLYSVRSRQGRCAVEGGRGHGHRQDEARARRRMWRVRAGRRGQALVAWMRGHGGRHERRGVQRASGKLRGRDACGRRRRRLDARGVRDRPRVLFRRVHDARLRQLLHRSRGERSVRRGARVRAHRRRGLGGHARGQHGSSPSARTRCAWAPSAALQTSRWTSARRARCRNPAAGGPADVPSAGSVGSASRKEGQACAL